MNLPVQIKCVLTIMVAFAMSTGAASGTLVSGQLPLDLPAAFMSKTFVKLLPLFFEQPETEHHQCRVNVLPGDSQNLLEAMANSGKGCVLQLTGEYVFSTEPPTITHRLQASPPVRQQQESTLWYSPAVYMEDNLSIFTGPAHHEETPVLRDTQPAATLVIGQGTVTLDTGGELYHIGIVDKRPEASTGSPVLTLARPSEKPVNERLNSVLFDHHYPLVSDITNDHPYWRHEEAADQIGGAVRRAAGYFATSARNTGGRWNSGHSGGLRRGFGSGGSGGDGDDPRRWWLLELLKKRRLSNALARWDLWLSILAWIPAATVIATTYRIYVQDHEIEQFISREKDAMYEHLRQRDRDTEDMINSLENRIDISPRLSEMQRKIKGKKRN